MYTKFHPTEVSSDKRARDLSELRLSEIPKMTTRGQENRTKFHMEVPLFRKPE